MNIEYLNRLKDESGLTAVNIADQSGIPVQTVRRIFSGATESPTISNMAQIVTVLNGSLDILMGIKNVPAVIKNDPVDSDTMKYLQGSIETIRSEYRTAIRTKDNWLKSLFIYAIIVTVLLVVVTTLLEVRG